MRGILLFSRQLHGRNIDDCTTAKNLLDSEEDKHVDLAILGDADMDELPLDPGTGLVWRDLEEGMDSVHLWLLEDVLGKIVVSSNHHG